MRVSSTRVSGFTPVRPAASSLQLRRLSFATYRFYYNQTLRGLNDAALHAIRKQ
jgi:hypothetical protein